MKTLFAILTILTFHTSCKTSQTVNTTDPEPECIMLTKEFQAQKEYQERNSAGEKK
jgi:hypothetical protein